ncbi:hypothetical protein HUU59_12000 [bacterium]|nr:hypothetical protein [bacterium]
MEQPVFSWRSFDRMSQVLQSVGYVVVVFGTITGLIVTAMTDSYIRLAGVMLIVLSVLIGLYHVSFSMVMTAMHKLMSRLDAGREEEE